MRFECFIIEELCAPWRFHDWPDWIICSCHSCVRYTRREAMMACLSSIIRINPFLWPKWRGENGISIPLAQEAASWSKDASMVYPAEWTFKLHPDTIAPCLLAPILSLLVVKQNDTGFCCQRLKLSYPHLNATPSSKALFRTSPAKFPAESK
ncbi:hypothetical protein VTI74DRAFT_8535 [Chaetomium olivicolor]